jgi:tripartite-type tricarboxylate transporter receptor subunit TctC
MSHNRHLPRHARTTLTRRLFVGAGAAWALNPLQAASPEATAWPTRPIEFIVPWPAGGATDVTIRILTEEVERTLGQPIVVLNKPGAAGTLVAPLLKAARPDGYTIGQVPLTVYRHSLMREVDWDPVADLSPIIQVSGVTFGILVPASSAWKSLPEMIDWAKKHPGELLLGSTGVGTTAHLAMEEVLEQNDVRYVHVPYKGTADQMLAIVGEQIMAGVNSTGFAPWVDQGKMRLLAVFTAERSSRWPKVPTLREQGYPQAVYTSPWGLAAPRGTPEAVIQKLHDAFHKAMMTERVISTLDKYDQKIDYLNTRDYSNAIRATMEHERKLLKRMNLLARPQ